MDKDWKFFIVTSFVVAFAEFASHVDVRPLGIFWPDSIIFSISASLVVGFIETGLVVVFSGLLIAWTLSYGGSRVKNIDEHIARVKNIDMHAICCTLIVAKLLILAGRVLA